MKRLAIFCDGTWNDTRMPKLTNVARLAKCVRPSVNGIQQIVFYDSGVGVPGGVSRGVDKLIRLKGGAFGRGLDEKIENAYRFLVLNYEVGDEIYVFGFSRGAYTARSLCGLVRKCGILRRDCFVHIPKAMELYRDRAKHPSDVQSFRDHYAHKHGGRTIATGSGDLGPEEQAVWRFRRRETTARAVDEMSPETLARFTNPQADTESAREQQAAADDIRKAVYQLTYLGVWDTVGSLGVPLRFPITARLFNSKYAFHDTNASSLIQRLRHAVAVDEDRWAFDSAGVANIDELNLEWARTVRTPLDQTPYAKRPYQQRWFPGDHGAVGGGNPEPGLSSAALLWIAEGAERAGLALDRGGYANGPGVRVSELDEAGKLQNPLAEWRVDREGRPVSRWKFENLGFIGGYKERLGPRTLDEVHETTLTRLKGDPRYRPGALRRFTGKKGAAPPYRWVARLLFPLFALLLLAVLLAAGLVAARMILAVLLWFEPSLGWVASHVDAWSSSLWRILSYGFEAP